LRPTRHCHLPPPLGSPHAVQALDGSLEDTDLSGLLQPSEAAAFERLAAQGRLSHLLAPWAPWWEAREAADLRIGPGGQRLIAPAGGAVGRGDNGAAAACLPEPPPRALPSLASLSRHRPSLLLRYQCVQLLYAYCFVLRRYDGDPAGSSPLEAAQQLLLLAPPLEAAAPAPAAAAAAQQEGKLGAAAAAASSCDADPVVSSTDSALGAGGGGLSAAPPSDAASALRTCALAACAPPGGAPALRPFALAITSDVATLLRLGRPAVVVALTDLGRLVAACGAAAAAARDAPGAHGPARAEVARLRRGLKAAAQKLLFFSAWVNEQLPEVWEALAHAVAAEHAQHAQHAHDASQQQRRRGRGAAAAAGGVKASLQVVPGAAEAAVKARAGGGAAAVVSGERLVMLVGSGKGAGQQEQGQHAPQPEQLPKQPRELLQQLKQQPQQQPWHHQGEAQPQQQVGQPQQPQPQQQVGQPQQPQRQQQVGQPQQQGGEPQQSASARVAAATAPAPSAAEAGRGPGLPSDFDLYGLD
jgi:hypothetical protein